MTHSPAYLSRNKFSYCFRFKVPKDLHFQFGKKELRYSLCAGYLSQAKHHARLLAGLIQKLIYQLREHTVNLTEAEIAEIIDVFKDYALKPYLSWNLDQAQGDGSPGIVEMHGDLRTRIDRLKMALKAGPERESWITSKLDSQLEGMQHDFETDIDKGSPQYRDLCRQLVKSTAAHLKKKREQLESEYSELELGQGDGKRQVSAGSKKPKQTSDTLEQAFKDYWDEHSDRWKQRSVPSYETVRTHSLKILGKKTQIHKLDYTKPKKFRNGLRSRKLSASGEPLAIERVNFFIKTIGGVYDLAMRKDKGLDRINPADGLQMRDKKKPSEKQDLFTTEELEMMFCKSREYGQDKHIHAMNRYGVGNPINSAKNKITAIHAQTEALIMNLRSSGPFVFMMLQ